MSERLHACVYRYVSDSFVFSRELEEELQNRYIWHVEDETTPDSLEIVEELDLIASENPEFKEEVERFKKWQKELETVSYDMCLFVTK